MKMQENEANSLDFILELEEDDKINGRKAEEYPILFYNANFPRRGVIAMQVSSKF